MKKQYIVPLAAFLLVALFAAGLLLVEKPETGEAGDVGARNESVLIRDHSPSLGSDDAEVTIVEFFDPACGTCRVFHPIVKGMMAEHPGKIRLVMRYAPLHPGSDEVVKILEGARLQGKFWEVLEAGYRSQPRWTINHQAYPDLFWQSVAGTGLDAERMASDVRSRAVLDNIRTDVDDATALGVNKTPGFFVNGRPLTEFGERQLRRLVESELAR